MFRMRIDAMVEGLPLITSRLPWSSRPYRLPRGTEVVFLRFREFARGRNEAQGCRPGIYRDPDKLYARLSDGTERLFDRDDLRLLDEGAIAFRPSPADQRKARAEAFLRPLPETPFVEGDYVFCRDALDRPWLFTAGDGVVAAVRYLDRPSPTYDVAFLSGGGLESVAQDRLAFVGEGPHRRWERGVPPVFTCLAEEADFYTRRGESDWVWSPEASGWDWDLPGAYAAIRDGRASACVGVDGYLGSRFPSGTAKLIRFHAPHFHSRLRKGNLARLRGLGVASGRAK